LNGLTHYTFNIIPFFFYFFYIQNEKIKKILYKNIYKQIIYRTRNRTVYFSRNQNNNLYSFEKSQYLHFNDVNVTSLSYLYIINVYVLCIYKTAIYVCQLGSDRSIKTYYILCLCSPPSLLTLMTWIYDRISSCRL